MNIEVLHSYILSGFRAARAPASRDYTTSSSIVTIDDHELAPNRNMLCYPIRE